MSLSILTSALGLNIGATIAVANTRAAVSMAEIGDTKVAFSNVAREWR